MAESQLDVVLICEFSKFIKDVIIEIIVDRIVPNRVTNLVLIDNINNFGVISGNSGNLEENSSAQSVNSNSDDTTINNGY